MFYTFAELHIATLTQSVHLGKTLGDLPRGDWLMNDQNAFEIAMKAERGTVKLRDHGWVTWLNQEHDAPTLIMRSGAYGDLLMLSPILLEWHLYTNQIPHLSCFKHHHCLFENFPVPIVLEEYPLPLAAVNKYKEVISLDNTLEVDHEYLPLDIFHKKLELVGELRSRKPVYIVTSQEQDATKKWLFSSRPNLAIQPFASTPNRDYPRGLWNDVILKLEKKGWGIILLGKKGQIPPLNKRVVTPFIRNLAEEDLSLRESAAVLSQCTAFCGVDSFFMHLAAALDIPSVSLHGPFKWQTRTADYKLNTAITGVGECAGCSWHKHDGQYFPPNKPCTAHGVCVVLASIQPDRIVAKIDQLKP